MKTLCFIAGTRPEIIKIAPVILEFRKVAADRVRALFCSTGQHRTMAEQAASIFGLKPDFDLGIMSRNQTLNQISARIFARLPAMLEKIKPDLVVIQGDTTTAAMAGLAAFHTRIPVAHIEAGLRTFDLEAPFPEELNRRLVASFCAYNFAPTENARRNLLRENCRPETIFVTGNTVVDALEFIERRHDLDRLFREHFAIPSPYVLITAHRRESFGGGLENICLAISEVARRHRQLTFVYPVHLNPNVRRPVERTLSNLSNVFLKNPVSYLDLLALLKNCDFCVTDSGGIQEEAPSFGRHTIVLRDRTERIESLETGISELAGTSRAKIVAAIEGRIAAHDARKGRGQPNPFGAGKASGLIVDILLKGFADD